MVSQDCRWNQNTAYICKKARVKLWILRRLLKMELDVFQLFNVYTKEIRSILEMAVPVWHPGLTKQQSADIERISFKIILQSEYRTYELACSFFNTETLENRRIRICHKYGTKNLKSDHSFFTTQQPKMNTRNKSDIVRDFKCNFERFSRSSLPYLARLLNSK